MHQQRKELIDTLQSAVDNHNTCKERTMQLIPIKNIDIESERDKFDTPYLAIVNEEWHMLHPFHGDWMGNSGHIFDSEEIDALYKLPDVGQVVDYGEES